MASDLTKILLETKQEVPDFLEQYIPDGYVAGAGQLFWDDDDEQPSAESDAESSGAPNGIAATGDAATGDTPAAGFAPGTADW